MSARLRPLSATQRGRLKTYLGIKRRWLRGKKCERCGTVCRIDVHHKAGRLGNFLFETRWWAALCRYCHNWVHDHPALAREKGWLVPSEVASREP